MNKHEISTSYANENLSVVGRIMRLFVGVFLVVSFMHTPPENIAWLAYIDALAIALVMTAIIGIDPLIALLSWFGRKLASTRVVSEPQHHRPAV